MKRFWVYIFLIFVSCTKLLAQGNELELAKQFAANGEQQKALEIYQKLYKQDNETYFSSYISSLLSVKKFDEAENVTKKMVHKFVLGFFIKNVQFVLGGLLPIVIDNFSFQNGNQPGFLRAIKPK